MIKYIAVQVATGVGMLLAASVLIFVALRLLPGDPTAGLALTGTTRESVEAIREELGLNDPIPVQYVDWLGSALQGDFGHSYFGGSSTTSLILERLPATITLAAASLLIGVVIAIALGAVTAMYEGRRLDAIVGGLASAGIALPPFFLAVIAVAIFSVRLHWLPSQGYVAFTEDPGQALRHLILPAGTLSLLIAAPVLRFFKASIHEVTALDFVRTARGKGLQNRSVVLRHVLPNAAVPSITYVGLIAGHLLGGVVLIEYIFAWPGVGSLAVTAVTQRDYVTLQGVVLFGAATFIAVTIVTDLITLAIDPRLRARAVGADR